MTPKNLVRRLIAGATRWKTNGTIEMRRRPLYVRTNIDKQMNKLTDKTILGCWTVSAQVHMGLHIVGSIVQRAIGEGGANSAQKGSYVALL